MILWGVIWGGLLGLLTSRGGEFGGVLGAIVGALAGWTLRNSVRSEFARMQSRHTESARAAAPLAQPATAQVPLPPDPAWFQSDDRSTPALETVSAETSQRPVADSTMAATLAPPPNTFPAPPPLSSQPAEPNIADKLVAAALAWLTGGNTVVRIGVVVLFIGLSFLARYAAENALLPVELRLALVGASGMALLMLGFRLRNRRKGYALTLQGAGVAVLYLTVFASFRLYQLVPPGLALAVMVSVCALSTAIALMQNARALAFIGFAGGFLAPILASTGEGSHVVLFAYYTLLNLAILFIAYRRSWRLLNLLGFFMTFGIATAWGRCAIRRKTTPARSLS